ncbi:hypothetical protein BN59_02565 [Legionella massiliensis]|uniref:Cytochrome b561 bacterial/Ni-hydrogenase domain-containing protein n=1 Tax=Legionella massiliensis TaxID=1034943 RepID=A0A078KUY7_9GAMM|nr:cytochrome b [Legionella massiliensis]CDZ78255.1 hypothetical protein BN59_02565 [Legionella massiliensis]CEE13993.1 hypothetical protein BN1094_02565 [Legionella massiliensis]
MISKQVQHYSKGSKFLHWLIAVVVIIMLCGSYFLDDLPEQYIGTAFMFHKSIGITILFLMLLRLIWILYAGKPDLPQSVPAWQRSLSKLVQYALYFFVILMPLCGWIMSTAANKAPYFFNMFRFPLPVVPFDKNLAGLMKNAHNTIAWILIALVVLHIAGVLKHHFIDKDNILRRMLP